MQNLPKQFIENMKKQLPTSQWEAFFAVYEQKAYKGVRLNPLKGDIDEIKTLLPFLGERVSWEEYGYYTDEERVGNSVFHHAGLFYSQEPSAMSAAPLLQVKPYERVLDLCSAPGGKGTQLACRMDGKGIIVLNEPVSSRAKILSQNIERLGVENAVVTCEFPEKLAKKFDSYFDKILVDAPCSGEGMFRKYPQEVTENWNEENIALCIERGSKILDEATKMLKKGGRLVYSTCTFAYGEDEGQVFDYLQKHPEMRLIKSEKLYPHIIKGEGHFVALFEKIDGEERELKTTKEKISPQSKKAFESFEKDFFAVKRERILYEVNGVLYDIPKGVFDFRDLSVLRVGVRLGEIKNGRFEPSHALCMSVKKSECKRVVETDETEKYLRGETLEKDIENGWCLVTHKGYPLGLGKAVNGVVKNHLPKGIRKV